MTKFEEFEQVIARLRAPDGCPWDRAQTHASLKRTCIEEAAEEVSEEKESVDLDLTQDMVDPGGSVFRVARSEHGGSGA